MGLPWLDGAAMGCIGCAWLHCLDRGVITLPAGDDGQVLSMTPALGIDGEGLDQALEIVCESLR